MSHGQVALDKARIPDLDGPLREHWAATDKPKPIFIMGLHRSGTTFLYESLSRVLPVAKVTLQDVVFFPRLVHSQMNDGGRSDRRQLESYFTRHRLATRLNDNIRLSADTAEEYGWILKRVAGSFKLGEKTLPVFEDLRLKLKFLHPDREAILLKNPWDTSLADRIARWFPETRFIFIRRDPIEILNSELRNALSFGAGRNPLLYLLINGVPELRAIIGAFRLFHHVAGKRAYSRLFIRFLFSDIRNNLRGYEAALRQIPAERAIEIGYRELVDDTTATLTKLAGFLGLPLSSEVKNVRGKRRSGGVLPAVATREQHLRKTLVHERLDGFLEA